MWLIRTKLEAPAPTHRAIARARLRRYLADILRSRLTLVHAPAGFGKTSLLAEWQRCLRGRNVRTAWLSLDRDDSDPLQFLAYLTASLELTGIDFGHLGSAAERGFPSAPVGSLVAAITLSINRSKKRVVVFVDDHHRLQGHEIDDVMTRLIDGAHGRISFVIASRERSGVKSSGVAPLVIPVEELRFSVDEAGALLTRSTRAITDEDRDQIVESADGWAIALTAARNWLENGWSVREVRDSLQSPTADLGRYITDQVLLSLTGREREFLQRTAIVERFDEDLAATLADRLPASTIIASLERKDLLVVLWDGDHRWLRYHRLIAETAVAELERNDPDLVGRLHLLAAEWFFQAGHRAEALSHAAATGNDELLTQLFDRAGGWKFIVGGHVSLVRRVLSIISPEKLRTGPRSHLAGILMLFEQGRPQDALRELEVLTATHAGRVDPRLSTEIALFRIGIQGYTDKPIGEEQSAALASMAAGIPRSDRVVRALLAATWHDIRYERGELELSVETANEALLNFRAVRSLLGEVLLYARQGRALIELGRLRDARIILQQAWHLAREVTMPIAETRATTAAVFALMEYEHGNLQEAEQLLLPYILPLEQREAWFECLVSMYSTACALSRHRDGKAAALDLTRRARETARVRQISRLEDFADILELRERVMGGETTGAAIVGLESAITERVACESAPRMRMRATLELARLTLARGDHRAASTTFSRIAADAKSLRHVRIQIEGLIGNAVALHRLGQTDVAAEVFDDAVNSAANEGYRQVFSDFGAALLPLLQIQDLVAPDPRLTRERDRFLHDVLQTIQTRQEQQTSGGLSEREYGVLKALAEGQSNKFIARTLQVSENTVKFHLKNIFTKLGVASRADAIAALASLREP